MSSLTVLNVNLDPTDQTGSLEQAWQQGPFSGVGRATRSALLETASLHTVAAGEIIQRADTLPKVSLILEGLVRVLATTSSGRRVAFRYAQAGECVGLICSIVRQQNVEAEAFTRCVIVRIDPQRVSSYALSDPALSWAIAEDAARTASTVMDAARRSMFGSIRTRVAWHLLDMAVSDSGGLIVRANQWEVAESVGSVRDVVARTMNEFGREGLIVRKAQGWRVLDPSGLHDAAADADPRG